ncbi:hypothetical protein KR084_012355 [Drosophila pseudotakahashii]|nr:hypothetical protein KR084_012355 [Drosophila pseudotakahashii]
MSAALWIAFYILLLSYQGSAQFLEQNCGEYKNIHIPFPWLVTVRNRKNSTFICAGTLINERFVLTASSCIKKHTDLNVRLVENNINLKYEEIVVEKATLHRSPELNDIALLKLRRNVVYKPHIQPICINVSLEEKPMESTFEISRENTQIPEKVECSWFKKLLLFITLDSPCLSNQKEVNLHPELLEKGSPDGQITNKIYHQKGILIYHNDLTNKDVYTDVRAYVDWIVPIALQVEIIMAPELSLSQEDL